MYDMGKALMFYIFVVTLLVTGKTTVVIVASENCGMKLKHTIDCVESDLHYRTLQLGIRENS